MDAFSKKKLGMVQKKKLLKKQYFIEFITKKNVNENKLEQW